MMKTTVWKHLLALLAVAAAPAVAKAASPPPPPGGGDWIYIYDGEGTAAGDENQDGALDGTWNHDNGSDTWDGSLIGAGSPGGILSQDGYLRLQDPGDPRDYGLSDPSNRKLYFTHNITAEGAADDVLDQGLTLAFRARLATGAPLDDQHPDGGSGILPWPAAGLGYVNHDGNKGNIGVRQANGGIISFSLVQGSGRDPAGLVVNANDPSNTGANQRIAIPTIADWHEFVVNIAAGGSGTHVVDIQMDGAPLATLDVIAGGGQDQDFSYLAIGVGSTGQIGAFDLDYVAWTGVTIPEPASALMLALAGSLGFSRRRR